MTAGDPVAEARDRALRYLETRERSRREVSSRLRRYGYERSVIESVMDWLEGLGYIDDRRFAGAYAEQKARAGWGARRIYSGLSAAGVAPAVISEALDELTAGAAARTAGDDLLVALVRRRFARDRAADRAGADRRALAFLQRRGHDWETAVRVLRAAFDDPEDHDDEDLDGPSGGRPDEEGFR